MSSYQEAAVDETLQGLARLGVRRASEHTIASSESSICGNAPVLMSLQQWVRDLKVQRNGEERSKGTFGMA